MISTLTRPQTREGIDQSLFEDVRTLLPSAVLARPASDTVGLHTWVLVSEALEASAHAISFHGSSGQHSVTEVLIGYAIKTAGQACRDLPARSHAAPGSDSDTGSAGSAWRHLERSWLRLAAQLARPGNCDMDLLIILVHEHRRALLALKDCW